METENHQQHNLRQKENKKDKKCASILDHTQRFLRIPTKRLNYLDALDNNTTAPVERRLTQYIPTSLIMLSTEYFQRSWVDLSISPYLLSCLTVFKGNQTVEVTLANVNSDLGQKLQRFRLRVCPYCPRELGTRPSRT